VALCRMFNQAIRKQSVPRYLSSDHDPLFRFHPWQANLRALEVEDIKTVPYAPLAHPFVERLLGTIRRECLDRTLFWTTADLESKLLDFKHYYNGHRAHAGLEGRKPEPRIDGLRSPVSFCCWEMCVKISHGSASSPGPAGPGTDDAKPKQKRGYSVF